MNKTEILKLIVAKLIESLEVLQRAAQASHAEATHESSKAENKYDTRGLEAAYLAGGQARQARDLMDSITIYKSLAARDFATAQPIDVTALVELETDGSPITYFIGPKNGGLEIEYKRNTITVITPQSPLGQNLMGRKAGDRWQARLGASTVKYRIMSII
jgi:transcription elongation GreA/GreB family factor